MTVCKNDTLRMLIDVKTKTLDKGEKEILNTARRTSSFETRYHYNVSARISRELYCGEDKFVSRDRYSVMYSVLYKYNYFYSFLHYGSLRLKSLNLHTLNAWLFYKYNLTLPFILGFEFVYYILYTGNTNLPNLISRDSLPVIML